MPKSKEHISTSEDSGSASSEEEVKSKSKPKTKKPEKRQESSLSDSESEEDVKSKKRAKKVKEDKVSNKKAKKESKSNEDNIWDLGNNKQVTIRNFKGKWYVDIREMYMDKDGEMKPSKKGVCLNMQNWRSLVEVVEDVDKTVKSCC